MKNSLLFCVHKTNQAWPWLLKNYPLKPTAHCPERKSHSLVSNFLFCSCSALFCSCSALEWILSSNRNSCMFLPLGVHFLACLITWGPPVLCATPVVAAIHSMGTHMQAVPALLLASIIGMAMDDPMHGPCSWFPPRIVLFGSSKAQEPSLWPLQ